MKYALAFDIGGTKIYCAKVNETGEIVSEIENFSTRSEERRVGKECISRLSPYH